MQKTSTDMDDELSIEINQTKKWYTDIKKSLIGFFFAFLASLSANSSNVVVKKTVIFNAFENSAMRFVAVLIVYTLIAKYNKMDLLGEKKDRTLLLLRAVCGITVLFLNLSLKLIDPSDMVSLFSMNILFIALLSKLILKEKFMFVHLLSLVLMMCGVVLITQPDFLMHRHMLNAQFNMTEHLNNTVDLKIAEHLNITSNVTGIFTSSFLKNHVSTLGYVMAICAAISYSFITILTKKLNERNIHFSIIGIFAGIVNLPFLIILSAIAIALGFGNRDFSSYDKLELIVDAGYSITYACLSMLALIFWITSLKYEDASKIAMFRTIDILLTFLLQYFILGIESNFMSIIGSICITSGTLLIMSFKLIDKKVNNTELEDDKVQLHMKDPKATNCFNKLLFAKF